MEKRWGRSYVGAHEDQVRFPAQTVDEDRRDHDHEEVLAAGGLAVLLLVEGLLYLPTSSVRPH